MLVPISPNSELAALLDTVSRKGSLTLVKSGIRYRLSREDTSAEAYDPKKVTRALRKTAGAWADIDGERLMKNLYTARAEGSRPAQRPPSYAVSA